MKNKLKIQYMSDLHLEFGSMDVPERLGDVLVLAGDIHTGYKVAAYLNKCAEVFPYVLYVFGNHEFYHDDYLTLQEEVTSQVASNVFVLDNKDVTIEGVHFVGSLLWSDMTFTAFAALNDSRLIQNLSYNDVLEEFKQNLQYLKDTVTKDCVVITHHAPDYDSIAEMYKGDKINSGFACSILHHFEDVKPKVWIHGHLHNNVDYLKNGINVVSNCRGYISYYHGNELGTRDFNPTKIIEV